MKNSGINESKSLPSRNHSVVIVPLDALHRKGKTITEKPKPNRPLLRKPRNMESNHSLLALIKIRATSGRCRFCNSNRVNRFNHTHSDTLKLFQWMKLSLTLSNFSQVLINCCTPSNGNDTWAHFSSASLKISTPRWAASILKWPTHHQIGLNCLPALIF